MPSRTEPRALLAALAAFTLSSVACSDDEELDVVDAGAVVDLGAVSDSGVDADLGVEDAGSEDAGALDLGAEDLGSADAGPGPSTVCTDLQLPVRTFQAASSTYDFGDVAGDFTVNTLDGSWQLEQTWTGCESYVFVSYIPTSADVEDQLWTSAVTEVVASDVNAHFFYLSFESDEASRRTRVEAVRTLIETELARRQLDAAALAAQRARFHYVTDLPTQITGSVGAWFTDYLAYAQDSANYVDLGDRGMAPPPLPFAMGIDREQKWDSVGSLSEYVGGPYSHRMTSYAPTFYDYKVALEDRVAAEIGVDQHVLLSGTVTDRIFTRTATLPVGAAMEAYDTLEVDVAVTCNERNVFGCSEWDRIARIEVCLDAACETRRELVRWITPYWRRGGRRWVMDASSLLGLVRAGGLQTFRIEMGPSWERATARDVTISLRLSNKGKTSKAVGAVRAFSGGTWDASYNQREPFSFTVPTTATKVELVTLVSGHGQVASSNCAEWCDHRHNFSVNGSAIESIRHLTGIGNAVGCTDEVALGLSPGQYGNWAPERAFWCPGVPVVPIVSDITSLVTLGQTSTVTYQSLYRGVYDPPGGSISLSTYVVWSE